MIDYNIFVEMISFEERYELLSNKKLWLDTKLNYNDTKFNLKIDVNKIREEINILMAILISQDINLLSEYVKIKSSSIEKAIILPFGEVYFEAFKILGLDKLIDDVFLLKHFLKTLIKEFNEANILVISLIGENFKNESLVSDFDLNIMLKPQSLNGLNVLYQKEEFSLIHDFDTLNKDQEDSLNKILKAVINFTNKLCSEINIKKSSFSLIEFNKIINQSNFVYLKYHHQLVKSLEVDKTLIVLNSNSEIKKNSHFNFVNHLDEDLKDYKQIIYIVNSYALDNNYQNDINRISNMGLKMVVVLNNDINNLKSSVFDQVDVVISSTTDLIDFALLFDIFKMDLNNNILLKPVIVENKQVFKQPNNVVYESLKVENNELTFNIKNNSEFKLFETFKIVNDELEIIEVNKILLEPNEDKAIVIESTIHSNHIKINNFNEDVLSFNGLSDSNKDIITEKKIATKDTIAKKQTKIIKKNNYLKPTLLTLILLVANITIIFTIMQSTLYEETIIYLLLLVLVNVFILIAFSKTKHKYVAFNKNKLLETVRGLSVMPHIFEENYVEAEIKNEETSSEELEEVEVENFELPLPRQIIKSDIKYVESLKLSDYLSSLRDYLYGFGISVETSLVREYYSSISASKLVLVKHDNKAVSKGFVSLVNDYLGFNHIYLENKFDPSELINFIDEAISNKNRVHVATLLDVDISNGDINVRNILDYAKFPTLDQKLKLNGSTVNIPKNLLFIIIPKTFSYLVNENIIDGAINLNLEAKLIDPADKVVENGIKLSNHLFVELIRDSGEVYFLKENIFKKLDKLEDFVNSHDKKLFNNRIVRQMEVYISIMLRSGAEELEAVDSFFANKLILVVNGFNLVKKVETDESFFGVYERLFDIDNIPKSYKLNNKLIEIKTNEGDVNE